MSTSAILVSFAVMTLALIVTVYLRYNIKQNRVEYLVFSSVGDRNNVDSWISDPGMKNFDLAIYYYGDKDDLRLDADKLVKRKGLKFENFYHYLEHNSIRKYKAIWVVDDDILLDTRSINKMFTLFTEYGLLLGQPSFSRQGKTSWEITRHNPGTVLRYTNFIENGVAIFSTEIIYQLRDSFSDAGTGYGIDFIWPSLLGFPTSEIAVIDAVQCHHPRSDYSALDEVVPRHLHKLQGIELLKKYGLLDPDWEPPESYPWPEPFQPREYSRIVSA